MPSPDPLFDDMPDAARFERTMLWVRQWFNVLPLAEAVDRLAAGSLPAQALVITFDDGYADNESIALPILKRLGLPATFFISTAYLDSGGPMWNDALIEAIRGCNADELDLSSAELGVHCLDSAPRRRAAIDTLITALMHLPPAQRADRVAAVVQAAGGATSSTRLMMTPHQVQRLWAGRNVDRRTHCHAPHPDAGGGRQRAPRDRRRQATPRRDHRRACRGVCVPERRPGRDYSADHVQMVRSCGFKAAVSTAWGSAGRGCDRWQLPRFTPGIAADCVSDCGWHRIFCGRAMRLFE